MSSSMSLSMHGGHVVIMCGPRKCVSESGGSGSCPMSTDHHQ